MIGKLSRLEGLKKIADMETGKETPKKKEFKIGEVFQCGLVKLRCEKDQGLCFGCAFNDKNNLLLCEELIFVTGNCSSEKRDDKTDVIFVKVEE